MTVSEPTENRVVKPVHPSRGSSRRWVVVAALIVLGLATGAALAFREGKVADTGSEATYTVDRADMRVTVVEAGTLQAANSFDVYSELEGQNTIVKIAAEGAYVKEGDLLLELDTSQLTDKVNQQEIAYEKA